MSGLKQNHKLGSTLDELFDSYGISSEDTNSRIQNINILNIIPNPNQPRKNFKPDEIKELRDSIKEHGIIQPIIVIQKSDSNNQKFIIIAGERRFRAAKECGINQIPCVVISESSQSKLFEISLIENVQRSDLNIIEEADAYSKLHSEYGYTHDEIGKKIGKSRAHITNAIRVSSLPKDVKDLIVQGKISFGHAKILASREDASEIAQRVIKTGMSVRSLEEYLKEIDDLVENGPEDGQFESSTKDVNHEKDDYSTLENDNLKNLSNRLGSNIGTFSDSKKIDIIKSKMHWNHDKSIVLGEIIEDQNSCYVAKISFRDKSDYVKLQEIIKRFFN